MPFPHFFITKIANGGNKMRKSYIYIITNLINGKMYIGQTVEPRKRWSKHCSNKRQVIDKAIDKYSKECFSFEIIEECNLKKVDSREKYWIKKYNTFKGRGYNLTIGGESLIGKSNPMYGLKGKDHPAYGYKKSKEELKRQSKRMSGKNNPMYGVKGKKHHQYGIKRPEYILKLKSVLDKKEVEEVIKTFNNTLKSRKEIADDFGVSRGVIEKIIKKEYWCSDYIDKDIKYRKIKINKKLADKIYLDYKNNDNSIYDLAQKYNIGKSTVHRIVSGKHRFSPVCDRT